MILILKTSHHGPSDAMHNPSQLLRFLSKEVCLISHGDQHAFIGFLIPRSLILKRVILFSIHSKDGNPSRVNIKQLCGRLGHPAEPVLNVLKDSLQIDNMDKNSNSSHSSVSGGNMNTADFTDNSGNDTNSSEDIFVTQNEKVTTLKENIFSKGNLDSNPSTSA
ncbi:hypothetical protein Tco_0836135 [Tanacetum coccineum]